MTTQSNSSYVIPKLEAKGGGKIFLIIPASMLVFGLLGHLLAGEKGMYEGVGTGFPVGIVLTIVSTWAFIVKAGNRMNTILGEHTFQWYRDTFPDHAHANGHVSCRHCGSHHVRAKNMMHRTFMRTHSCNQCGKTLYFSKEL